MRIVYAVFLLVVGASCSAAAGSRDGPSVSVGLGAENISITFTTDNGWVYDGRIESPKVGGRNGWGVMILSGGLGTAIDWFIPGEMTIDGEATRDGDAITEALLEAGFTVMRWDAIRRGDPERAKDPLMMDPPSIDQTAEQARKAFAAFREKNVVPVNRTFLLGHSLGARRACILLSENPKIPGVVMLAGAALIPSKLDVVREIVAESVKFLEKHDSDKDHQLTYDELAGTDARSGFGRFDVDHSGTLDRHEWAVCELDRSSKRWEERLSRTRDRFGYSWAATELARRRTPTLLLVGEFDERWRIESYVLTRYLRGRSHPDYLWKVVDGVGHNLGAELAGPVEYKDFGVVANAKVGPISKDVIGEVVAWLNRHRK